MRILLVYSVLFSFYLTRVLDFKLTGITGINLLNLTIYFLLFYWASHIVKYKKVLMFHSVNKYLFIMISIVLLSVPLKILRAEIPNIHVIGEFLAIKTWLEPIIIFFVLYNVVADEKTCKRALFGLLILLMLTVGTQLLAAYNVVHVVGGEEALFADKGRVSGLGNPNDYASYLVLFIPLILSNFLFKRNLLIKLFSAILFFFSLAGLLTTGSRGGTLSFLFSVLIYVLMLNRIKILSFSKAIVGVLAFVLVCGAVFVSLPSQVRMTVSARFVPNEDETVDQFTSGRTQIWRHGMQMVLEAPIIGHGHNSFLPLQQQKFLMTSAAHSKYLSILVNYGIVGLISFLMVYFKLFQTVWNQFINTREEWNQKIYMSYLSGFSGLLFSLIAINGSAERYPLWIYTAVISVLCRLETNKNREKFTNNIQNNDCIEDCMI